jgi:hypothetical protein
MTTKDFVQRVRTYRGAKELSQNYRMSSGRVVTPAKAGVQEISESLDSGFRRNDG